MINTLSFDFASGSSDARPNPESTNLDFFYTKFSQNESLFQNQNRQKMPDITITIIKYFVSSVSK